MALCLKNLDLISRADVTYKTASELVGRYLGQSANNTLDAMKEAKGGVLFIDEAYGMKPSKDGHNSYGREIMQVGTFQYFLAENIFACAC